jgi:putative hemolysin
MIPVLLLLLGFAAVYVGTIETAFSALMRLSLRLMAERGGRDDRLGFYLDNPILLFVPARLMLGIIFSLATMCIAILTGGAGFQSIGLLLLWIVVFILVCEHVVPLLIVRKNPERVLEIILPPFDAAARFLYPMTGGLVRLIDTDRRDRPNPAAQNGEEPTKGEGANGRAEAPEEPGLNEGDERRLLQSIVDFGGMLVREVMTPRPDIVAIQENATLDELRALFREQEYSRIPVYKENLDNILGIVFVKDLIQLTDRPAMWNVGPHGSPNPPVHSLHSLIRPATFVPETKRVPELLKEFQRRQVQIAIVVDEYGGTAGLVTIEDLLEEIVGEILDEKDEPPEPEARESPDLVLIPGSTNIADLNERFSLDVPDDDYTTIGGYVFGALGRLPVIGDRVTAGGAVFTVRDMEGRRIETLAADLHSAGDRRGARREGEEEAAERTE